jgi:DNA integrity scanning protein DisA with diadenylate cyclase activity
MLKNYDQIFEEMTPESFIKIYDPIEWAIEIAMNPDMSMHEQDPPEVYDDVTELKFKPCDAYITRWPIKDGVLVIGCFEQKKGVFSKKKIVSIAVGVESNNILRIVQHYIGTNLYYELMEEWKAYGKAGNWTTGFRPISKPIFFSHEVGRRKMAEIIIKFFNNRVPAQDFERRWIEERELCRKRREWTPQE